MKLFFNKDEQGDIVVSIQNGTTVEPFNYLLMLHQLMENNTKILIFMILKMSKRLKSRSFYRKFMMQSQKV